MEAIVFVDGDGPWAGGKYDADGVWAGVGGGGVGCCCCTGGAEADMGGVGTCAGWPLGPGAGELVPAGGNVVGGGGGVAAAGVC